MNREIIEMEAPPFASVRPRAVEWEVPTQQPPTVLNVGCGGKGLGLPIWYDGWEVIRLDIDPHVEPDIEMDARNIGLLTDRYDAVFCSHNLEHFTTHDAGVVVRGMRHVIKASGFVDIHVPDIGTILQMAGDQGWDLDTFLYQSAGGPICVRDVLYGYERQTEFADHPEYMLHRNGYSARTLTMILQWCGFAHIYAATNQFDLRVVAFNEEPNRERLASVGLVVE
jgi:hypothetical protein